MTQQDTETRRNRLLAQLRSGNAVLPIAVADDSQGNTVEPVPMTAIQKFIARDDEAIGTGAYYCPIALRLSGSLNRDALRAALSQLAVRHTILNTRISWPDGCTFVTDTAVESSLLVTWLPENGLDQDASASRFAEQVAYAPMNIRGGRLWQAHLGVLGERDHVLVIVFHHLICDGWSLGILVNDLVQLYEAALNDREARLEPAPQFRDRAAEVAADAARTEDSLAAVASEFDGIAPLNLPAPSRIQNSASISFGIDAESYDTICAGATDAETTPYTFVLAGLQLVLANRYRQRSFAIATVVSGREDARWANVVGPIYNRVPIRCDVFAAETFEDHLRRVHRRLLTARERADVPYGDLLRHIDSRRASNGRALISVVTQMAPQINISLEPSGMTTTAISLPDQRGLKRPLTINLTGHSANPRVVVNFDQSIISPDEASQLGAELINVVGRAAQRPSIKLDDVTGRTGPVVGGAPAAEQVTSPPVDRADGDLATLLAAAWSTVLDEPAEVGRDTDFYEAGGHSLSAVRLVNLITSQLGVEVGLADLVVASTPAALAERLRHQHRGGRRHRAIELAAGPPNPSTLVLVHPLDGRLKCYQDLAADLGRRYHVIGVDMPFDDTHHHRLAGIAAAHAHAIEKHAGDIPVTLVGWSTGGIFALATATALLSKGVDATKVILIDTRPPGEATRTSFRHQANHLSRLADVAASGDVERVVSSMTPMLPTMGLDQKQLMAATPLQLAKELRDWQRTLDAYCQFSGAPRQLSVTLIPSEGSVAEMTSVWPAALPEICITQPLSDDNFELLRPRNTKQLSAQIDRIILARG